MKHQELLVDVNFYQARDSLLEQAISSKEQKEPKCESRNSHPSGQREKIEGHM